ncbi:hypothetical protein RUM44_006525 [Polyplax serrata]|uniref:Uncharacterized protein n=1 Tax=Polyplax serrata TaxID=468196 RepID=A0ABR1AJ26_POLSC
MSPVLNCIPSSPPSDQETYPKVGSTPSDGSNRSPVEMVTSRPTGDLTESESSCCDDVRQDVEEIAKRSSPTNNNNIPLNYKKSPSPNDGLPYEVPPARPWNNSSPNFRNSERDQSVSPSSSSHRPSSCQRNSLSPDVSSETSRIPSHSSSEAAHEAVISPESFRSPKMSATDIPYDIPFPFHDGFRLSNSFVGDPINPYFRLTGHPLNPFQPSPEFLGNPYLTGTDPKLLLNNPGLGLITHQLHHLNGLSANPGSKIPPTDLHRMSVQQLQFLQNHLHGLPNLLQPLPYGKYADPKSQLSMLIQARKHPKLPELHTDASKKDGFLSAGGKAEDVLKVKDRKTKALDVPGKNRKVSVDEGMEVDTYEDNNSDSDELLSVGSVSPPPNGKARTDMGKVNDAGLSGPSKFPNRTISSNGSKKYPNGNSPVRLQEGVTNTKTSGVSNRTLKFSIDNILKSDFGNDDVVKEPKQVESKKQKENERTLKPDVKRPETEKEKPVDLSQENANSTPGTEQPMLWPAWVYCTRYSDRPSSGECCFHVYINVHNVEARGPRPRVSPPQFVQAPVMVSTGNDTI